jgi:two-component system sensor kinase ParS
LNSTTKQQPDASQNRELIADMYADLGELKKWSPNC